MKRGRSMKRLLSFLKHNNRGTGIVTVLITVFFITALGSALLFTTYTVYQVKVSERRSKENFYSAETAMSEVRAGIQRAVTGSLAVSYTDVLEHYTDLTSAYDASMEAHPDSAVTLDEYLEEQFHSYFTASLLQWKDGINFLFSSADGGHSYTYSPAVLLSFLQVPATAVTSESGGVYSVSFDGKTVSLPCGSCSVSISEGSFTLENITVRYADAKGYMTQITTDITVNLPPFSYTPAAYSVSGVVKFSLIAKGKLTVSASGLTLSGSAYAGSISGAMSGASLTHSGGTLISAGNLTSENGALIKTSGSDLWVHGITVGDGNIELSGNTYVADDLTLSGTGANAVLSGNYYGFGNSSDDSSKSSSLLINGRGTSLNLNGLDSLMLSGSSFIDVSGANSSATTFFTMGQSVAARSDQLAYLVPAECLPDGVSSNPCLVSASSPAFDTSGIASKAHSLTSEYPYYAYVDGGSVVYVNLSSTGGAEKVAYFFLTFASRDHANNYFKGYFSQHSDEISEYLTTYSSYYRAATHVQSASNTYSGSITTTGSGESEVTAASIGLTDSSSSGTLSAASAQYQKQYGNLCHSLSSSISSSAVSPYEYVVNTTAVVGLPAGVNEFTDISGNVAAIIVNGNYTISADTSATIRIIIATGDVTVSGNFSGIVISGGNVAMGYSLVASPDIYAALQAKNGSGSTLLSFLNIGSNTGGSSGSSSGESWDVEDLVSYSNWLKH